MCSKWFLGRNILLLNYYWLLNITIVPPLLLLFFFCDRTALLYFYCYLPVCNSWWKKNYYNSYTVFYFICCLSSVAVCFLFSFFAGVCVSLHQHSENTVAISAEYFVNMCPHAWFFFSFFIMLNTFICRHIKTHQQQKRITDKRSIEITNEKKN